MQNYLFALTNLSPCISLAHGQLQQLLIGAGNPFFREETFSLPETTLRLMLQTPS